MTCHKLLTSPLLYLMVITNTLVFVTSQSTVGQYGLVKYIHHCIPGGRCQYTVTLPQCQQQNGECDDSSYEDKTILTELLQIVRQQSLQIQELSQMVQNLTNGCQLSKETTVQDCSTLEMYNSSPTSTTSGVNQIQPTGIRSPFDVYCEVSNSNVWTVIQRRLDGSVNFFRNWTDYKTGFGNIDGEYWLGNDNIYALTNQASYKLRIDLEEWDGTTSYAQYDRFWIEGEENNYILHLGEYSGTAGDSMKYSTVRHDGQPFSTYDRDNDSHLGQHCARYNKSGWWFNDCNNSNLNGEYLPEGSQYGIRWYNENGNNFSKKTVTMKVMKN
ncbi:fibrinogen-like protein 1 [Glandiceps talaboti]